MVGTAPNTIKVFLTILHCKSKRKVLLEDIKKDFERQQKINHENPTMEIEIMKGKMMHARVNRKTKSIPFGEREDRNKTKSKQDKK